MSSLSSDRDTALATDRPSAKSSPSILQPCSQKIISYTFGPNTSRPDPPAHYSPNIAALIRTTRHLAQPLRRLPAHFLPFPPSPPWVVTCSPRPANLSTPLRNRRRPSSLAQPASALIHMPRQAHLTSLPYVPDSKFGSLLKTYIPRTMSSLTMPVVQAASHTLSPRTPHVPHLGAVR